MKLCHCGRPLHYTDPAIQRIVSMMVADLGPDIEIHCHGRIYQVQRHYIALHGIKAEDLPHLGFPSREAQEEAA